MAKTEVLFGLRSVCLIAFAFCAIFHLTLSDTKICGKSINEALTLMCGERGYNTYKNKRNFPLAEDLNDESEEDDGFDFDLDRLPFWTSMSANSLAKLRRRRNGIYYECCLKPCTKQELMTFCRP
ncbi:probable insulin-like peptide 3 [Episyrphus balteatus]|uniref:probable insulin-like peptide 3 n=1 Tax=Episyrphus balteatus TaxID=286459 RepID=UPI00248502EA|nr:probable insulin-like peptide 3 [Episyrphus balteatus]